MTFKPSNKFILKQNMPKTKQSLKLNIHLNYIFSAKTVNNQNYNYPKNPLRTR